MKTDREKITAYLEFLDDQVIAERRAAAAKPSYLEWLAKRHGIDTSDMVTWEEYLTIAGMPNTNDPTRYQAELDFHGQQYRTTITAMARDRWYAIRKARAA
jgi:hypothetical protein